MKLFFLIINLFFIFTISHAATEIKCWITNDDDVVKKFQNLNNQIKEQRQKGGNAHLEATVVNNLISGNIGNELRFVGTNSIGDLDKPKIESSSYIIVGFLDNINYISIDEVGFPSEGSILYNAINSSPKKYVFPSSDKDDFYITFIIIPVKDDVLSSTISGGYDLKFTTNFISSKLVEKIVPKTVPDSTPTEHQKTKVINEKVSESIRFSETRSIYFRYSIPLEGYGVKPFPFPWVGLWIPYGLVSYGKLGDTTLTFTSEPVSLALGTKWNTSEFGRFYIGFSAIVSYTTRISDNVTFVGNISGGPLFDIGNWIYLGYVWRAKRADDNNISGGFVLGAGPNLLNFVKGIKF
ncbi:MAG: hypothetical protein K1X86_16355 [Ignavibacteria bacterium]|nr:hypothetical protein [Ignavibacteria bacterium]